jgi:galactokinase
VNLIGDHTDYNRGLALPMAVGLGVTVTFSPTGSRTLEVTSSVYGERATIPVGGLHLDLESDLAALEPAWARLVAAMAILGPLETGGTLAIDSTLPVGSGLSSSAALSVALAEVFGVLGTPEDMARLCQKAEHSIGVPVGLMDPLVCAGGRAGHALLIDFDTMATQPVPIPLGAEIVVVDSGQRRTLGTTAYAARVAECATAAEVVGPLGRSREDDLAALHDPMLRQRARHVITECVRVRDTADALARGDLVGAGALLSESHRSLADDFGVSTPVLDELVQDLESCPGVLGARMTGAGFGGCVVALTHRGAIDTVTWPTPAWTVRASDGTVTARS